MTSHGDLKTMNGNAMLTPTSFLCARIFAAGQWSFLGLDQKRKWYSAHVDRPQGEWDRVAELMMIKLRESGHPVFRATSHCPEERSKAKEVDNYQYTSVLTGKLLKLFFTQ